MPAESIGALPDFVGIGALKAGTTYLDAMLRSHPGLSLPLHVKEVEYFSRHHDRGAAWYAKQFAPEDGRRRGEISPQYLDDARCAARIAAANPLVKVLVSVRDPVARAYSQFRHWTQVSGYAGTFEAFLVDHPRALTTSRYFYLLQPFRDVFPAEQMHIVVFEDMVSDPLPVLRAMYEFLGVDATHVPDTIHRAVYVSQAPRHPWLYVQGKKLSRWLYHHGAGRSVARLKASAPAALLTRSNGISELAGDGPGPPPAIAARLRAEFRDDAERLSTLLDRDLVALWRLNDC
jgi:hypothetical protein